MSELQKIDHLTKRCSDLLAEMKRHERENIKNKKRADQLQKEKDHVRSELTKQNGLKEKLEKLCRELQKENNKLKVDTPPQTMSESVFTRETWANGCDVLEREQDLDGHAETKRELLGRKVHGAAVNLGRIPRRKG